MHFAKGTIPKEYTRYIAWKMLVVGSTGAGLLVAFLMSLSVGAASIPLDRVWDVLVDWQTTDRDALIVRGIRLPQALAAMLAGGGLAISGAAMQAILRNPLGSPFTLGISHAAAFGAAFCVMILGGGLMTSSHVGAVTITNPYLTTIGAFVASLAASGVIVAVARMRGAKPEVMVLTGVALGALFTAGTMFLQYFATDVQLAAMVFWTFGDTARASWNELTVIALATGLASLYFMSNSWKYNAIDAGDETARGLGVRVSRVRTVGMFMAALLTAVIIAFLGIIGFVGLVAPHMFRRIIGADHRFLLPASLLGGALLLVVSDTVARIVLAPHLLPVSVLTAFLGAPVFLYLIVRRKRA